MLSYFLLGSMIQAFITSIMFSLGMKPSARQQMLAAIGFMTLATITRFIENK